MEKDILTMYFENPKKSGGGEIQSCQIDRLTNTASIVFTDHTGRRYLNFIDNFHNNIKTRKNKPRFNIEEMTGEQIRPDMVQYKLHTRK
jgi:hypothetical protein